jgi:6-phosphogluconolactonase (cycloisomerase 2 family)
MKHGFRMLISTFAIGATLTGCGGGSGPTTYTVGGTVSGLTSGTLVLNNNGGDALTISANSTAFTFATPLANGTNYSVTVSSQTSPQTCKVTSSTGSINSSSVNSVQISCFAQYLYLGLLGGTTSTNLLGYSINGANGLLTATQTPSYSLGSFVGADVSSMVSSTNSNYLYAVDDLQQILHIMAIDPATGNLSELSSNISSVGPFGIAMTPQSNFLYTSNYSGNVSAYSVNSSTGALTSVASPYSASRAIQQINVDASGKFVYAMLPGTPSTIYSYSLNQLTGALTPITGSPFSAGSGAYQLATNPKYEYLYVMNQSDGTISGFSINSTSGVLTSVAGSPFPAGSGVFGGAFTPDGKYLYVTNRNDSTVSAYSVSSTTGVLTQLTGSPFTASSGVFEISVDASGKYVYAVGNKVDIYSINPTSGILTTVVGSPLTLPSGLGSIYTVTTTNH